MNIEINPNVRNVAIILLLALLVAIIPGGGTGARVAISAVTLIFFGGFVFMGTRLYRENRVAVYALGDSRRAVVYAAAAVALLTLSATDKLLNTGLGTIVWVILLAACAYAAFIVIWAQRQY